MRDTAGGAKSTPGLSYVCVGPVFERTLEVVLFYRRI